MIWQQRTPGAYTVITAFILTVVIATSAILLLSRAHPTHTHATSLSSYCVGRTFGTGDTGRCVRDIQALITYMEHSGLTECPFNGSAGPAVNGVYSSTTVAQVKSVQQWAHCYAKQEGFTSNVAQTGMVGSRTWGELCTYGYTDPLRNGARGSAASIAAGQDAGCFKLKP